MSARNCLIVSFLNFGILLIYGETVKITNLGSIKGVVGPTHWSNKNILQFKGIPYGESPSGNRRFQPPISKSAWSVEFDASNFGRACPYAGRLAEETDLNEDLEDCLNLNVFTKNLTSKAPVMFLIHGGNFKSEDTSEYPPHYLLEKEIVLVTINYRIGALGFASTKTKEIPGNVGVLDIILALRWTQNYIEYFGGDAGRVTIFGQSAGGILASLLMISPAVPNDLFHRTILQSGIVTSPWAIEQNPIGNARAICRQAGCYKCNYTEDINSCLKNSTVKALVEAVEKGNGADARITIEDVYNVMPVMPKILMADPKFQKPYQMMAGTTKNDGTCNLGNFYNEVKTKNKDLGALSPLEFATDFIENHCRINDDNGILMNLAARILLSDPDIENRNFDGLWEGYVDLATVFSYKAPLLYFTELYTKNSANTNSSYLYSFDYKGEFTRWLEGDYPFDGGVTHKDDLLYLFPHMDTVLKSSDDIEMGKAMVDYWTSFASDGKPMSKDNEFKEIKKNSTLMAFTHINKELTFSENYMDIFSTIGVNNFANNLKINLIFILIYSLLAFKLSL